MKLAIVHDYLNQMGGAENVLLVLHELFPTAPIYTTIYELDSPDAVATPEFRAMRGWYQYAPHVRSRTQVIVPVQA